MVERRRGMDRVQASLHPQDRAHLLRRVSLRAGPGLSSAVLRDRVHTMGVLVRHDGHRVTAVRGRSQRYPWTTCPGAVAGLQALVGTPVDRAIGAAMAGIDSGLQCTHLFDLARLAVRHVARGGRTRYDVLVDEAEDGAGWLGRVLRDGTESLRWRMIDEEVVAPPRFAGQRITGGPSLRDACDGDQDLLEAATLLRRGFLVFRGGRRTSDQAKPADLPWLRGACHTFQPGVVEHAARATQGLQRARITAPGHANIVDESTIAAHYASEIGAAGR